MSKHAIVIDFLSVAQLARANASAARRSQQVKLVNAVFQGVLEAVEYDPTLKSQLTVWTDARIGEGLLFKSIANQLERMVTFRIDSESDLKTLENDLHATLERYRPDVIVVPLSWPELVSGPGTKRRRIRAMATRVLEVCKREQLNTAWDTGFQPVDSPDTSVDTIKLMAWLQDRGLDPNSWVFDLPSSDSRVDMMVARAHIDGVTNIKVLFRPADYTLFRTDDNAVEMDVGRARRIDESAGSRGIGQVYVGAPHIAKTLERLMDDEITADQVSAQVAYLLADVSDRYDREVVTGEQE